MPSFDSVNTTFERVDTNETGIDEINYAYALCQCPTPVNICWRVAKDNKIGFKFFTCPNCKTEIGVFCSRKGE